MRPVSSSSSIGSQPLPVVSSNGPFSGLVICVTGLSKEARKQVMEATKRLGGQYSPSLHSMCTHLVVQSFGGRKLDHALKHGLRNGLFVVTIGWFVDSVQKNVRLSETLYSIQSGATMGIQIDNLNRLADSTGVQNSCVPMGMKQTMEQCEATEEQKLQFSEGRSCLSGHSIYIDTDISSELRKKVVMAATGEDALVLDQWFVGCGASFVVCEGSSSQKYLGHADNVVTPMWVLKTATERSMHRAVCMSADLARQVAVMLDNLSDSGQERIEKEVHERASSCIKGQANQDERQQIVNLAKAGVRSRRSRRMQACGVPLSPITPSILLGSICWSISEPTSTAGIYIDAQCAENGAEVHKSMFFDAHKEGMESEASFTNTYRPLMESEKCELILKNHFLTILFPVDRYGEMGPSARTYFRDGGFTCLQVLDFIYAFYQEDMSDHEIEAAIHTDSRHADQLRSVYCSERTAESGHVMYKRVDFLGSRKSFEMLKRIGGDHSSNVYELLVRA